MTQHPHANELFSRPPFDHAKGLRAVVRTLAETPVIERESMAPRGESKAHAYRVRSPLHDVGRAEGFDLPDEHYPGDAFDLGGRTSSSPKGQAIPPEASFISRRVLSGEYYFLNLEPAPEVGLCVVCGGREVCDASYEIDRPGFRYHSIEYVESGSGTLTLGDASYPLKPGWLFRYGPGIPHRIGVEPGSPMVKYFVDFAGQMAQRLVSAGPWAELRPLRVAEPARLGALFDELQRIGRRSTTSNERLCVLLLEQILLLAADEAVPDEGVASAAWATYQRCRGYIEKHGLGLPSLAAAAAACSVSEGHLCRLFRRYGATSPYQLLVRVKMARAAALLLDPRLLVREVGRQVGYEDPYHFSKAFKRVYGLSPEAFRSHRRE